MSIDLQKRTLVENLCPWGIGFKLPISNREVSIDGGKKFYVSNEEIVALAESGNVMFEGTGGGDHARAYVHDEKLRKYIGYESEDGKEKQFILTDDECKKLLEYKTDSVFEKHLKEKVVCNHEKSKIMMYARKNKLNELDRVEMLEKHTGIPFKMDEHFKQ